MPPIASENFTVRYLPFSFEIGQKVVKSPKGGRKEKKKKNLVEI